MHTHTHTHTHMHLYRTIFVYDYQRGLPDCLATSWLTSLLRYISLGAYTHTHIHTHTHTHTHKHAHRHTHTHTHTQTCTQTHTLTHITNLNRLLLSPLKHRHTRLMKQCLSISEMLISENFRWPKPTELYASCSFFSPLHPYFIQISTRSSTPLMTKRYGHGRYRLVPFIITCEGGRNGKYVSMCDVCLPFSKLQHMTKCRPNVPRCKHLKLSSKTSLKMVQECSDSLPLHLHYSTILP